ncbi:hypothetical protein B0H19DRAFT_1266187 [Mycena capillaripes]|nr:hypothetical protein B0H19DRAFT_1266187 [Mycena capillaripes]
MSDSPMSSPNSAEDSAGASAMSNRRRAGDPEYTPSKRQAVAPPERVQIEDLQGEVSYRKNEAAYAKRKEEAKKLENRQLRQQLEEMQQQMVSQMKAGEKWTTDLVTQNRALTDKLHSVHCESEEQARQNRQYTESMTANQRKIYEELRAVTAQKQAQEKRAQELEREAIRKTDKAAALRAKLANQASGQTPRTRAGKIMGQAELRKVNANIPIIPFAPIPLPTTGSPTAEDDEMGSTIPTTETRVARKVKNDKCGVDKAEEFVLKQPVSLDEVLGCQAGYITPDADDYRLDCNVGRRKSRWNEVILDKLVDGTIIEGKKRHLPPVPRAWLLDKLQGQLERAHEAWARAQPRENETPMQAMVRANEYREARAEYTRGYSNKARKFDERVRIVSLLIQLKTGQNAPDLETCKRILQMIQYLGKEGMSSEEECETVEGGVRRYVFKVKVCVWRAGDVDDYLWMVDNIGHKLEAKTPFGRKGPAPLPRVRDGKNSVTGAPRGLPECLYNAAWIAEESDASPVFYEDLQVSKEAFYLLAAAPDMVA